MNREHVLAVILVLSLCANVYLVFTGHSSLNPGVQEFVSIAVPGAYSSNSSQNCDIPDFVTTIIPDADISMNISPDSVFIDNSSQGNSDQGVVNHTDQANISGSDNHEGQQNEITPPPTPDGWTTYTSKKYAFSVRYPTTWDLNDGSTGSPGRMLVLTAPIESDCDPISAQCFKYIASMTFEIDQKPDTLVLEDYFNSAVASLQEDYGITATSKSASCMLSGNRAYQIEFYTRDERGNPDRSYMQYYTLIDKKGYIISYTGPYCNWENVFSHNKGDAQRIIDSFWVDRTFEIV
jgi:hypothetical protein